MYLTKFELSLSEPGYRAALRDGQKMHQLVTGLFRTVRKDADILYSSRMNGPFVELYMYSAIPVDQESILPGMRLAAQRDVTPWLDGLEAGMSFAFWLMTAPYKKIACEGAKNSRRRAIRDPEERMEWLRRKAENSGFRLLSVQENPGAKITARHPAGMGGELLIDPYCYTGRLLVTDAELFRRAVREGIGPGKAYGLGMLILAG